MAQCRYCEKHGFLVTVDGRGLCRECQVEIYPQMPRIVEIIQESEKLVESSKNWKTRLSRCDDIDSFLRRFESYAEKGVELFNQPLRDYLQENNDRRTKVIEETIQSLFEAATSKVETAATPRTKISAAKRGIEKLMDFTNEVGVEHPSLMVLVRKLKSVAHNAEFMGYIKEAEKAEFKGNLKKALDQFQEALFFLKTDEIDDNRQASTIQKLEQKIKSLSERVASK